ncbi:MAG: Hsp20/alpha crystallin family protein [Deltaproteobacteria bacterium]|nr:Hsp20/alpha crystallin family protein [Deltaproteobacteria bacterium]MBW2076799.1 Hsp20/alpha crystallin family protein [Deltaproteobacteria bacterium]RLB31949.1 MAG: Hsp20/alpha crystallin family protein [Deltaproteobacteria bacterium]
MTRMLQLVPRTSNWLSLMPDIDLFDRMFDNWNVPSLWSEESVVVPAFDISETEKEYVISGEIPGIEPKDLEVTLNDGILTVKGEKKQESEEEEENYHRVERHYGSFQRSFRLPENIKRDDLDATYKDGILKLTLPKSEESKVKKIEVKEKKARKKIKAKKA